MFMYSCYQNLAPSSHPTELRVDEIASRHAFLLWNPPILEDQNGVIRSYTLNITEENTGTVFQITTSGTEILLDFLHPAYTYTCAVAAVTIAPGPYSQPLVITTTPDGMFQLLGFIQLCP